jgi:tripartite-type tricarboxylate transporter receptor subunit TctC
MITTRARRITAARIATALAVLVALGACATDPEEAEGGTDLAAEDWEPEYVDGVLQPLPDGFPEDELTIVSVDEPGSLDGLFARTLDEALADISPVDIVVSDEPRAAGGSFHTLADVMTRDGGDEGYYPIIAPIPGSITDFHVEPVEEETGITPDDVNYFISTEQHPWVVAQRTDAPWGEPSFDAFVQYVRDNPGEVRYIAPGVGAGADIAMEWLLTELDLEVEKIPAADRDAAMAAVGAGEGDVTMNQASVALGAEESGRAEVIFTTGEEVPDIWADNPGIASAADYDKYGLQHVEWGTVQALMVHSDVSDLHVRWLYELFAAGVETDAYQARLDSNPWMEIKVLTTEECEAMKDRVYENSEPIIRDIGLHIDG